MLRTFACIVQTSFVIMYPAISERICAPRVAKPCLAAVPRCRVTLLKGKYSLTTFDLDAVQDVRLDEDDETVDAIYRFLEFVWTLILFAVLETLCSKRTEQ